MIYEKFSRQFLIAIICLIIELNGESIMNKFKVVKNVMLDESTKDYLILSNKVQSKLKCVQQCNNYKSCISCTFDSDNNCNLYNQRVAMKINHEEGTKTTLGFYTTRCKH